MRRHAVGIVALLLLATGVTGLIVYGVGDDKTSMLLSVCLRIGMVLGAIWLAFPQLLQLAGKSSPWMLGLLSICGIVIILRPRLIVVIGPLLFVLGILYFVGWMMKPPS